MRFSCVLGSCLFCFGPTPVSCAVLLGLCPMRSHSCAVGSCLLFFDPFPSLCPWRSHACVLFRCLFLRWFHSRVPCSLVGFCLSEDPTPVLGCCLFCFAPTPVCRGVFLASISVVPIPGRFVPLPCHVQFFAFCRACQKSCKQLLLAEGGGKNKDETCLDNCHKAKTLSNTAAPKKATITVAATVGRSVIQTKIMIFQMLPVDKTMVME